jgi:class 3 adenylate cyclase
MRKESSQIIAMLFSDVAGFSKISDDRLYLIVKKYIDDFGKTHLNDSNHFLYKTWGDGILICTHDPHDLLELAIKLNDWFLNKNWIRSGFTFPLVVRIGLHAQRVSLIFEDNKITDIDGVNVNTAARIEPIVEPGKIYCSKLFHDLVDEKNEQYIKFIDLGERELAKKFGTLHLYELVKANAKYEGIAQPSSTRPDIKGIKVKKDYSDLEKDAFLKSSYKTIHDYFKNGMDDLGKTDPEIECRFEDIRTDKFICKVFVRGNEKSVCQIWIANNYLKGISYYNGISESDNASNESLSVTTDGYTLHLTSLGILTFGMSDINMNQIDAANYLWKHFMTFLER